MKPAPLSKHKSDILEVAGTRGPKSKYVLVIWNPRFEVDREAGKARYVSNRRPVTDPALIAALIPRSGLLVPLECCAMVALNDGAQHGLNGLLHRRWHIDRLVRERPLGVPSPRTVPKPDHKASGWPDTVGRDKAMRRHIREYADQFATGPEVIPQLGQNKSRDELRREDHQP